MLWRRLGSAAACPAFLCLAPGAQDITLLNAGAFIEFDGKPQSSGNANTLLTTVRPPVALYARRLPVSGQIEVQLGRARRPCKALRTACNSP